MNSTFVRPLGFYLGGFQSLPFAQYYFLFLSIIYLATLFFNFFLMAIIMHAESLHTPKYIAIFLLSIVDIGYSATIIPKSAGAFIFDSKFILYEACLTQMFFVVYFLEMESFSITILAYDRLISICFPLQSVTINTNTRMIIIILISACIPFVVDVVLVYLITRLSFCRSTVINSYFCDHGPVFYLACNDFTPNWRVAYFGVVTFLCVPLAFIIISYICILSALLKIKSKDGRRKAFKTCTTHLALVAIFYIPLISIYLTSWINLSVDTNIRIFSTSLAATMPPLLNPIIYTLKTEEIMVEIKKIFKRKTANSLPKIFF
ncbi:putative gustatory receptor clone PTE03 [Erpetoichthys calabaricus]|uniref:putative gustatory receptor clone PTE03 n=1 Tax=Erpetoichthys calabaricus TaxID=27687 RepID=UPI002233FF92|nr:putative gustatory receptor clone PTE03 [Erpetoichthys calabaricus]